MSEKTADKIMDIAERRARSGGYDNFSFREIATELGIKSASVHYHFPTKGDLGKAIAARYTKRFLSALGPAGDDPDDALRRYVAAYRASLREENLMCLCGMFGAEIARLPEPVQAEAQDFFRRNLAWLTWVYTQRNDPDPRAAATNLISTLEGGLILARSLNDPTLFDQAAARALPHMDVTL